MRFTLGKMFLAVAMLALACAGMVYRDRWWMESMIALTITLYIAAILSVIGLRGRSRVFAVVFAMIGGGYFILFMSSSSIREIFVTNHILEVAARNVGIPWND